MSLMRAETIWETYGERHFFMYDEICVPKPGHINFIRKPYKARIEIDGKNISLRPKVYLVSEYGKKQINEYFTANIFENYGDALASYKTSMNVMLNSIEQDTINYLESIKEQKELLRQLDDQSSQSKHI